MIVIIKYPFRYIRVILFFLSYGLLNGQELLFVEEDDGIALIENDNPRYFYRTVPVDTNSLFVRANYIHPLYGLDGEVLTEDFPEDHPHHHGIFWSWHQLYAEGKRIGDPWLHEGIEWKVIKTKTQVSGKNAVLNSEIIWMDTLNSRAVLKENLTMTFNRVEKDAYKLEFKIKLKALIDGVAIGGSEDAKGYGGFSARLRLPENVSFHSVGGIVEPQNLPVTTGPWINIIGICNSQVVIMGEPENLNRYQGWILRRSKSMQNMAFPGQTPLEIKKGDTISFRNQLLVHRNLRLDEINSFYKKFRSKTNKN